MKLSIIVPVYNEEETIDQVIKKLLEVKLLCGKEIIIVDDGSTDGTKDRIKNLELRSKNIKIIQHKRNQGKGVAIRAGLNVAKGNYILIQDADLEYNPEEIPNLIKPILKNKSKRLITVYGSRFKDDRATIPTLYLLGNKLLTFLTNFFYGTNLTDMETGYKLLPASVLKKVKLISHHFDIEPEITVKLIKSNIPIIEVPISYKGRTRLAGKKLTPIDAFEAIKALFYFRFFD